MPGTRAARKRSRRTGPGLAPGSLRRALLIGLALALAGCNAQEASEAPDDAPPAPQPAPVPPATYVGSEACTSCHAEEARAWRGSDHDRAMEPASAETVLGRFDGATRELGASTWTLFEREGRFFARDGAHAKGAPQPIVHTFGYRPLQQYLVPAEGGRLQVLPVAWDARPAAQGGERWLHLYEDDPPLPGDRLHWTGAEQTWNYQCAECHSTALRRGYDAATDRYTTQSAETDVACEACHGPASHHVAWAGDESARAGAKPSRAGLIVDLTSSPGDWRYEGDAPIAQRSAAAEHAERELATCGPCHARRGPLADGHLPGAPFLDDYRPALLAEGLYFADGQIRDEVYVWGSFVQSRMHAAGVTCTSCHDPHSLALRPPPESALLHLPPGTTAADAVCANCHRPEHFATTDHHGHAEASEGASCIACHMPTRTYMQIDERHDHSLRVPRPDLGSALGAPDACTGCHTHEGREPAWAAAALAQRGAGRAGQAHYGEAIHAARRGQSDAEAKLLALLGDTSAPAIARATAVSLLGPYLSAKSIEPLRAALRDESGLVRLGGLVAAEATDPQTRVTIARDLLRDPLRAVRIEAARILAGTPPGAWRPEQRRPLADALAEYRAALDALAERPESWASRGLLHADLGELDEAESAQRHAIRLAASSPVAHVNLADVLRRQGDEAGAERVLRDGLEQASQSTELYYALALARVRRGDRAEGLALLAEATRLAPESATYAYALALSLHEAKRTAEAVAELERIHELQPGDRRILFTLATLERDRGDRERALEWTDRLLGQDPAHRGARALRGQLVTPTH